MAVTNPYGTHQDTLRLLADLNVQRVLEYGGGTVSTPLFLNREAFPDLVELVTVEPDADWRDRIASEDVRHTIVGHLAPAEHAAQFARDFDLILVDDGRHVTERAATIRALSGRRPTAVVVIHDYEHSEYQAASDFDHVVIRDIETPWTGVMWNEDSPHGSERLHRLLAAA